MQIIIEIPDTEIPKQQDLLDISLHFIDGHVCSADGYGFFEIPTNLGNAIIDSFKCKNTPWNGTCDLCDIGDLCTEVRQLCR